MQKLLKYALGLYIALTFGMLTFYMYSMYSNRRPIPRYIHESYRLDHEVVERLNTKWNLSQYGFGGGGIEGLEKITYAFNAYDCRPKTLEEARSFVIECAEMALDLVNRDEKIRPYLPIARMQGQNIYLELSFPETQEPQLKDIGFVYIILKNGKIFYNSLPENEITHFETYPEALLLVQAQKSSLANDSTPHAKIPSCP